VREFKGVTRAVFPVAGLGTRFLPATKAMPKELLPIVDKPIIQFAVEEAIAAGITELVFITGRTKRAIEDHFDTNPELERELRDRGKGDVADMVQNIIPPQVNCIFIRQPRALGLGHAVLCAEPVVGGAPFAVLLADDFVRGDVLPTQQLIAAYEASRQSQLSVMDVAPSDVSKYGIVVPGEKHGDVAGLVEKPEIGDTPSTMASIGRYVLSADIFDVLRGQAPGADGEIQLADAIDVLARRGEVGGVTLSGRRFDCGNKAGYVAAIMDVVSEDVDL